MFSDDELSRWDTILNRPSCYNCKIIELLPNKSSLSISYSLLFEDPFYVKGTTVL